METKTDVSYEYRFLEFTTLSAAELPRSSAVRLASLHDLPAQLLELYQQGFSLVTLHPFVQPTQEREKTPLEHIFRVILIKKTDRSQKNELQSEGYVLELDSCSSLDHLTDQKLIPEFVKKVQEAASQGLKFVGVIPQHHCPGKSRHSAPAPNSTQAARDQGTDPGRHESSAGADGNPEPDRNSRGESPSTQQPHLPPGQGDETDDSQCGVNKPLDAGDGDPSEGLEEPVSGKMEILALFNKPKSHRTCHHYYPVTIPLRISKNGQTVSSLDANWLEHMSDHFRKGGVLVNAVFYLGIVNDSLHGLTDGVFIFEAVSTEDSKTMPGYDAIVVEQWTVLQGVEVQTDYVPLLNSLAAYGWQLTCVLPTPVIKTTREGNVSTKQIVFLQRPCLPQKMKKKDSKFQWRFSREDAHSRQMRKSKGKLGRRDKHQAGQNEKNPEDPFSKGGDVGNCVDGALEMRGQDGEAPEEKLGMGVQAVHNGPVGCAGRLGPDPGEEGREGCMEDMAEQPIEAEDH